MKKIFLIASKSDMVITFRKALIKYLQSNGCEVGVIAQDNNREEDIRALGVSFFCVEQDNRALNPFSMIKYQKEITKILVKEKPDTVFTFQLKPNIFGVKAAKKAGIKNIFSMVEGAGDVFINNTLKWKLIRFVVCKLYKSAFKHVKKVFFLNNDDKTEFLERKLVKQEQCEIIHGIGVDLDYFAFKPIKSYKTFLMVARMLKTKGVYEYCQCARIVKQKYPDAVFNYLGAEGTVKLSDIQEYIDDGSIHYLGVAKDVRPYLEDCSVFVLPSYREGISMSIMEAEATGRAILTSDNVGCRDAIVDGDNGFLVTKTDYQALAGKCCEFIINQQKIVEMGKNSRKLAENQFDCNIINQRIYEVICSQ